MWECGNCVLGISCRSLDIFYDAVDLGVDVGSLKSASRIDALYIALDSVT